MIRRWSRVNYVRTFNYMDNWGWKLVHNYLNIKFTRLFFLKITSVSLDYRQQRSRRKHLVKWLFLFNTYLTWAHDFRFNKHAINFNYNCYLFKFNYLSASCMFFKESINLSQNVSERALYLIKPTKYNNYSRLFCSWHERHKFLTKALLNFYLTTPICLKTCIKPVEADKHQLVNPWITLMPNQSKIYTSSERNLSPQKNSISLYFSISFIKIIQEQYKIVNMLFYNTLS